MGQISNTEKINIYVPEKTGASLRRDAELFEIYRTGRTDVNMNRFLSGLISGYYNSYKQERNAKMSLLKGILAPNLRDKKEQDAVARKIMEKVILPSVPKRKGRNPVRLPLKPTRETDQIITEIKDTLEPTDYLSQFLCRMFISYCEKPTYERERIIFRETLAFLEEACREHREISFATTVKPDIIHHVIPYEVVSGKDELFNYLLCQEYNDYKERNEARSYRLCRINRPGYYHNTGTLENEIIRRLEKTKRTAPQYAINEETEACLSLTPVGQQAYMQYYMGRPEADRTEIDPDGTDERRMLYYFSCSQEQLFRYLQRFKIEEVKILYPAELKRQLLNYYRRSERHLTED